ncbi:DUF2911 domain-containing protein [Aestuariibaculum suncheonense]|uniref:DUF2911 domain-containing protein n=1 Tax=Aestuariibaculum suncheonense TaxID=1028745 RepID=A0A8J6Q6D4_9FLAO|nr:DUF2911 domain-containing protein [Aestuariibaculum suncheonense]MBD0835192.1 DUF2911 domain-containing protein [Aestuariibaculum suncheonense]
MKKILASVLFLAVSFSGFSQIKTPQPSPSSKLMQTVGLTDMTLEYSRPSMRGRAVFGDLVPYDKLWRLGANANTKISFSTDVIIGDSTVKAGEYAIFATPGKDSWEVVFYNDTSNWGTPQKWDDSKVVAKAKAEVYKMSEDIETFTMSFDDLTNNSAVLGILWENVYAGVKIDVPTESLVSASIERTMNGPAAGDYFSAAVYYLQEGKDINQAKEWIDKSIAMSGDKAPFWQLRQQSLIYAKAGDKKGAIAAAKKSLAGAEAAGNADYVKMNKDSLKEWGAM